MHAANDTRAQAHVSTRAMFVVLRMWGQTIVSSGNLDLIAQDEVDNKAQYLSLNSIGAHNQLAFPHAEDRVDERFAVMSEQFICELHKKLHQKVFIGQQIISKQNCVLSEKTKG